MAPTRMSHSRYGSTHAYDSGEIDKLKALGWTVDAKQEERAAVNGITPASTFDPRPVAPAPVEKKKPGPKAKKL